MSRNAARLLWGDEDPVGKRVTLPLVSKMQLRTVVGIVGDVKQDDLRETPPPTVYTYSRERPSTGPDAGAADVGAADVAGLGGHRRDSRRSIRSSPSRASARWSTCATTG